MVVLAWPRGWKYDAIQEGQAARQSNGTCETVTVAVAKNEHRQSTTSIGTVLALRRP
jgi:hypothetical protein